LILLEMYHAFIIRTYEGCFIKSRYVCAQSLPHFTCVTVVVHQLLPSH